MMQTNPRIKNSSLSKLIANIEKVQFERNDKELFKKNLVPNRDGEGRNKDQQSVLPPGASIRVRFETALELNPGAHVNLSKTVETKIPS